MYVVIIRMTFGVDPDSHIDTVEQAKASTIEGTSKWSCKLSITGTRQIRNKLVKLSEKKNFLTANEMRQSTIQS